MLDNGTGNVSNVYSKDEVNNLVDAKATELDTKITNNTNEITNMKSNIEELQNNLNNYALQSELDKTNTNVENLSSLVNTNQEDIKILNDYKKYFYNQNHSSNAVLANNTNLIDFVLPDNNGMYMVFVSYQNTNYHIANSIGYYLMGYTSNYGVSYRAITSFSPFSNFTVVDANANKVRVTFSSKSYYALRYIRLW